MGEINNHDVWEEQVTRGHNIVADGWAGAANPYPHPTPHPTPFSIQSHTFNHKKLLKRSCLQTDGQTDRKTDGWTDRQTYGGTDGESLL